MFRARPIVGFLCRFAVVYGLLIAPWPGWQETYARWLQQSAMAVFGAFSSKTTHSIIVTSDGSRVPLVNYSLGSKAVVAFCSSPTGDGTLGSCIYVGNRKRVNANGGYMVKPCFFSSRNLAYLPTALVVALVLATGIGWRRRLVALGWGLLWIHLFIAFALVLIIVSINCSDPPLGLFEVPAFGQQILAFLRFLFIESVGANLAIAVLVWVVVTFRREDSINLPVKEPAGRLAEQKPTGGLSDGVVPQDGH